MEIQEITNEEMLSVPGVSRQQIALLKRIERSAKPSITYAVEEWADVRPEMEALFPTHWKEIALDQDQIKLAVDYDRYEQIAAAGAGHIVTVRADGKLVGYHVSLVATHPHYKNDLHGICDLFFILPEYRKGRIGIRMFQFVEETLKARGVVKMLASVKLHYDIGKVLSYLGWNEIERTYSKYIGG